MEVFACRNHFYTPTLCSTNAIHTNIVAPIQQHQHWSANIGEPTLGHQHWGTNTGAPTPEHQHLSPDTETPKLVPTLEHGTVSPALEHETPNTPICSRLALIPTLSMLWHIPDSCTWMYLNVMHPETNVDPATPWQVPANGKQRYNNGHSWPVAIVLRGWRQWSRKRSRAGRGSGKISIVISLF